jgi:hypothetical protein
MDREITDVDRAALVRCAVTRVGRDEMKAALARTNDPSFQAPTSVTNALKALRKHRDPTGVVTRPQYRAALPYLAAVVADACVSRTIEVLGDHSEDPSREQLVEALEEVRGSFADSTIGVMLASVADADMPSSDLCFELADTDERFGLTGWEGTAGGTTGNAVDPGGRDHPSDTGGRGDRVTTPEQREARRLKKQKDAEERRRKMEVARRAGEQVRRARKQERSAAGSGGTGAARSARPGGPGRPGPATDGHPSSADDRVASVAPRLNRRASLTPLEEEEFDRADPWVAAVVFAWVPFDSVDPEQPGVDGKSRRCVVVAGSPTDLLVRPGYSEGGMKSRDWKSVPLRHWKRAGFDQPTWIDSETLRVPRPVDGGPVGWLEPDDWNSLW